MRPLYRRRKVIFLALIPLLLESIAGTYFFDALSNVCAIRRKELETIISKEQNETRKPASTSTARVIEGPNGTKEMIFEIGESVAPQAKLSGEMLKVYTERLAIWETLKNDFDLIRDIHKEMYETIICVFCIFSLGLGLKKLLGGMSKVCMKM